MAELNLEHYKLIIFDWDGTLMDSIGRIVSSMQAAAKSLHVSVPSEYQVKQIIGLSLPTAVNVLFPSVERDQQQALIAQYHVQYVEKDNTPTPLFSGALSLLESLENDGKILAVATGKARKGLERVMAMSDTQHFFAASQCADEANSKPDPQMLLNLLSTLNIAAEDAIMIGDTRHDLQMAQNAGIASIGVTMGVHNKEVLNAYNPVAIVDSLSELQCLFTTN